MEQFPGKGWPLGLWLSLKSTLSLPFLQHRDKASLLGSLPPYSAAILHHCFLSSLSTSQEIRSNSDSLPPSIYKLSLGPSQGPLLLSGPTYSQPGPAHSQAPPTTGLLLLAGVPALLPFWTEVTTDFTLIFHNMLETHHYPWGWGLTLRRPQKACLISKSELQQRLSLGWHSPSRSCTFLTALLWCKVRISLSVLPVLLQSSHLHQ